MHSNKFYHLNVRENDVIKFDFTAQLQINKSCSGISMNWHSKWWLMSRVVDFVTYKQSVKHETKNYN